MGPATSPSTIEVGEHFGTVRDANVFLDGVATTNLESLHVLLVAPDGRRALLLGHAGGANAYDDVLLLDDESAAAIPDDAAPASSDVRPSVYGSPGSPPDPAGALSGDTALSTFDGALAEGVWALYVYDDDGNDVSVNGWTLDLSLVATPYPSRHSDVGPAGLRRRRQPAPDDHLVRRRRRPVPRRYPGAAPPC